MLESLIEQSQKIYNILMAIKEQISYTKNIRLDILEISKGCDCLKKQLQGIAIILVSILLMIGFGNEPVFDFSFRWSVIFSIVGITGVVMTFLPDTK